RLLHAQGPLNQQQVGEVVRRTLGQMTGGEVRRFKGPSDIVWSVAFSRDGKYVATGAGGRVDAKQNAYVEGEDNTVRMWEAATGKEVKLFKGHVGAVHSVAFSTNGKRLFSGDYYGTVMLWDISMGKEIAVFRGHTQDAQQVLF